MRRAFISAVTLPFEACRRFPITHTQIKANPLPLDIVFEAGKTYHYAREPNALLDQPKRSDKTLFSAFAGNIFISLVSTLTSIAKGGKSCFY